MKNYNIDKNCKNCIFERVCNEQALFSFHIKNVTFLDMKGETIWMKQ